MSDQSPLIVPLIVEAFVVNNHTRRTGSFYRAEMQYNDIQDPGNGDLGSTDLHFIDQTNPQWSRYYNGVYLKWRLPDAFTRGVAHEGAAPRFPCVPNRWLVVRYTPLSANAPVAWLIESDYVWPFDHPQPNNASQIGSMYVQPISLTDNTPIGQQLKGMGIVDNLDLSAKRAVSVASYLISHGVNPALVSAQAFGESHSIAANDTPEGRAKNRRVDITLTGDGT